MKKNNSIEILRVVVMIFIVVHHCVVSGLGLNNSLNNTSTYLTNSNVVLAIMNSIVMLC